MKALKTILIILVLLFGVLLILGAMADKNYRYERSVTIAAPVSAVWPHVNSLAAMDKWSPWNEKDPAMKKSMEGEDGKPGAIAKWEGNSDVGKGEQKIVDVKENEKITTELHFLEPFENTATGELAVAPANDSTRVTWSISGENDLMGRVFGLFMDMDAMIGPDFEKGLGYLKTQAEESAKQAASAPAKPNIEIMTGDRPAGTYVGIKSKADLPQGDIGKFYMENVPKLYETLGKANVKPGGPLCGLYYDWNEEKKTTHMMICVPVAEGTKVKGLETDKTEATQAYWTVLNGPYSGMMAAHMALGARIEADSMDHAGPVLEEYVVGMPEPDSTKYVTNIIYPVKPKS